MQVEEDEMLIDDVPDPVGVLGAHGFGPLALLSPGQQPVGARAAAVVNPPRP